MVHQKGHVIPCEVVLVREKTFRRVVRFEVMHGWTTRAIGDQGFEGGSVGFKSYTTVHVQPQIWPDLAKIRTATNVQNALADQ